MINYLKFITKFIFVFFENYFFFIKFFIIQIKGLRLSFSEYYAIIKIILANHSIGKLLMNFHEVKMEQKVYILLSVAFYFFSIYQNILTCLNFKNNMIKIALNHHT